MVSHTEGNIENFRKIADKQSRAKQTYTVFCGLIEVVQGYLHRKIVLLKQILFVCLSDGYTAWSEAV